MSKSAGNFKLMDKQTTKKVREFFLYFLCFSFDRQTEVKTRICLDHNKRKSVIKTKSLMKDYTPPYQRLMWRFSVGIKTQEGCFSMVQCLTALFYAWFQMREHLRTTNLGNKEDLDGQEHEMRKLTFSLAKQFIREWNVIMLDWFFSV